MALGSPLTSKPLNSKPLERSFSKSGATLPGNYQPGIGLRPPWLPYTATYDNPNAAGRNVLADLNKKNKEAFDKAKSGTKYKATKIKTGDGYGKTDFGEGAGAAIPWMTELVDVLKAGMVTRPKEKDAAVKRRLAGK